MQTACGAERDPSTRTLALVMLGFLVAGAIARAGPSTEVTPDAEATLRAAGCVFWDEDGDGVRDPGEAGVPDVRLTAAHTTALTDAEGRWELRSRTPFVVVSLSFPSGTWPTSGWFRRVSAGQADGVDFGLRRAAEQTTFCFVQMTDPHGARDTTMPRVYEECRDLPLSPQFYVCTGDLRSGDPSVRNTGELRRTFGAMGATSRDFPAPLFMVPGNHDTVGYGGAARERITTEDTRHPLFGSRCWERFVCPSHWSFSYSGVHFMGVEYAQYIDGRWTGRPPAAEDWLEQELETLSSDTRTVLFAHSPRWGEFVVDHDLTLGLAGDSHTEGPYYRPGTETPAFGPNVLVGGLCQTGHWGSTRYMAQDGRPMGYRICVVEGERLGTFYKALGEPHTIMVNEPRRFLTPRVGDSLEVRGQVFDPNGEVNEVSVRLSGRPGSVAMEQRPLWVNFRAEVNVEGLPEGFHDLCMEASYPDGRYQLVEPYLLLTDAEGDLSAEGDAVLHARVRRLESPCTITVNGAAVAEVPPMDEGEELSVPVPARFLKRLNRVSCAAR